jgi:hypothetical protein
MSAAGATRIQVVMAAAILQRQRCRLHHGAR